MTSGPVESVSAFVDEISISSPWEECLAGTPITTKGFDGARVADLQETRCILPGLDGVRPSAPERTIACAG